MREGGEKREANFFGKEPTFDNNFKNSGRKEIGEKFGEVKDINSENSALERIYADADKKILDRLEVKYGKYIPSERLAVAKKEPADIQNNQEFESELKRRFSIDSHDAERVLGYQHGREVHVKRGTDALTTLTHERLHQVAHPEAGKVLGNHIYEGMTEDLANQEHPSLRLYKYERMKDGRYLVTAPAEVYPEKRNTLNLIKAQVPESCLLEAYFQGNDQRLEAFIDSEHGKGAWKEIRSLLEMAEEKGDSEPLEKARKLLKS